MAVPPRFAGQKFQVIPAKVSSNSSVPKASHTVEVFLDYCCPFSGKMFKCLYEDVFPAWQKNAPSESNGVSFVFRQQVQPWHPSSTLMHEAALAMLQIAPEKFWVFSSALFAAQREYFDESVVNETRNQTYRRLAKLAATKAGVDEERIYKLLEIPDKGTNGSLNVGNGVTTDLKFVTRQNRTVGVHVTPTVVLNGVVQADLSSGTIAEQWQEWLKKNIA